MYKLSSPLQAVRHPRLRAMWRVPCRCRYPSRQLPASQVQAIQLYGCVIPSTDELVYAHYAATLSQYALYANMVLLTDDHVLCPLQVQASLLGRSLLQGSQPCSCNSPICSVCNKILLTDDRVVCPPQVQASPLYSCLPQGSQPCL